MSGITRREFIIGGVATASLVSLGSLTALAQENKPKIKLGVIGCGGRGTWIANLFKEHGGYEVYAAADYFEDRVSAFGEKFGVPKSRRFTTLSGYKRLLDMDVDAVAIESPPYFHPEQAADAVEAGKHVYLAKPVAVDAPGCRSIAKSGEKATENNLCFLVDFQTRANEFYQEAIRRVHDGAIGDMVFGEASYHCGRLRVKDTSETPEARLRNWVFDKALSGDIITEQNIHVLDVASWIINDEPLHAFGTGGRKVRTDVGDCWDYFTLHIQYPNNVGVTFSSRQFDDHGTDEGIKNRMFGSKGVLETKYGGRVIIRAGADDFYKGGTTEGIYQEGAETNIAKFHDSILEGRYENATVAPSVRSTLLTVLCRNAAYRNRVITWKKTVRSRARLEADLRGLKS